MEANVVGRKHRGLRNRMERFARIRSANRALPAAASDMAGVEKRENEAAALRSRLSELAAMEAPAAEIARVLKEQLREIDSGLETMESDLFRRFDLLDFVSLRASVPRSVERNRREVVALVEALLGERKHLLERLPRVEYLITILSTEEVEGRRNIVHDPTTLTPLIDAFESEVLDAAEADAVAMELYQAATLDSDSENFEEVLHSLRARKKKIGIGCLAPSVLRAVVTYNARMFNSVESMAEASRASDAAVDEELLALSDLEDGEDVFGDLDFDAEMPEDLSARDASSGGSGAGGQTLAALLSSSPGPKVAAASDPKDLGAKAASVESIASTAAEVSSPEAVATPAEDSRAEDAQQDESEPESDVEAEVELENATVYKSKALGSVLQALRMRIEGERVGRRGSAERIAIVLDQASLDEIETEAICAESPDRQEILVARTAIVGLILRDLGPIEPEIRKIGMDREQLTDEWVRALNEDLGQLVSEKLGDTNAYEVASKLSRVKSKNLLKPMKALKKAEKKESSDGFDEMGDLSALKRPGAPKRGQAKPKDKSTARKGASQRSTDSRGGPGVSLGENRFKIFAAAALVCVAIGLTVMNTIDVSPADIRILKGGSLADSSPYLKSAYRNEDGKGGLLVGRVDSDFAGFALEKRIEEAQLMAKNFAEQGIREAMLYDDRGLMHVHYAAGVLHRPRPEPVRQERTRGGRQGLMGGSLLDAVSDDDDDDDWGSDWDDEDEDEEGV